MATSPTTEFAPMNPFQRLIGVFFQPKATFTDVVARPGWVLPVVLLCICSVAVIFTFTQRVGWHAFMEKKFAESSRAQQMPVDEREKAIDAQAKYAPIFAYVFGSLWVVVSIVVLAAVGLAAFNLTAGAQLKFKTCMGIVAHAGVPFLLAYLLAILVILIKPPDMVDLENLLASNPGALLSSDAPKWLVALLGSIDLFSVWSILLLALGFSTANSRKITFSRALTVWIVLWIIFIGVKVGWVAAFS
jgi:hypothetical protein